MQAAVGCAQLKKFPSFVERRRHNFDRLLEGLKGCEDKLMQDQAGLDSYLPAKKELNVIK